MNSSLFDQIVDRRGGDSLKWNVYPPEVLPLWVADMDFPSPQPVIDALQARVAEGVFGYGRDNDTLLEVICERMARLYQWTVRPEEIVSLPGLVSGFNIACRAVGEPGDGVLAQSPVYPPFLAAPGNQQRRLQVAELRLESTTTPLTYGIDFDAFAQAIEANTRLFLLCHPHNPVGRGFTREELQRMAEICLERKVVLCSDEIHADLLLEGRHQPLATLSPEIASQTISLFSPNKTFNIAGLGYSYAIIQNPQLKARFQQAMAGIVPYANTFSVIAALAAYREGDPWLREVLAYLRANRDFALAYLRQHLPHLPSTHPTATYLLWLDCRALPVDHPHAHFLGKAKVALNDGKTFGPGGEGFVRLNFGCARAVLEQGLERMRASLAQG